MSSVITEDELPDDVTSAESFLARHQEHKAEIDTRQRSVNDFYQAADKLIADGHSASADVKDKKQRLSKAWQALQVTWSEKGVELTQSKEVQVFKRDADQLEAWLNARDLDQESSDVGDSLEALEELLKKHDEFEKMLLAQEMKFLGITKLTQQEEEINKQKEEENEMREEQERREREEEEKREQELRERKRQEQLRLKEEKEEKDRKEMERKQREVSEKHIRLKEENDRKEKERKEREEREKMRALEEKKRAEAKAKQEEEISRKEAERQQRLEEQRRQEEQNNKNENNNNNKSASSPQDQRKASVSSNVEGILQRKQELESGGKKAHARMWKTLYTVLRGHQLLFYREKKDAKSTNYAAPPVDLTDGFCEEASDVVRRKNAFRLLCDDDSDFFFVAKDPQDLKRWMKNISEATCQIDLDIPSPPPPQPARLPSAMTSSQIEPQESSNSHKVTKPYGRTSKPLITVTSFDDDEDVLIDPPPPPQVNIPSPAVASDFSSSIVITESDHENNNGILADIGDLPIEPDSLPPVVPSAPPDFADFDDSLDGEELPVLPASPPPEFLSDDENGFDNNAEDSPLANIISQLKQPTPPPRKSKAKPVPPLVAPKLEGRLRSDSHDSTDSGGKGPKPPIKPKPVNLTGQRSANNRQAQGVSGPSRSAVDSGESAHDDKRHEKRKGVLGNIFKKKK